MLPLAILPSKSSTPSNCFWKCALKMSTSDNHSYSTDVSNNNANISSFQYSISDRSPLLPLYHNISNYSTSYVVPGSADDQLRLIYLYVIFPIIMFFYLVYSYLSFSTLFPNKNANGYAFVALGTICLLSFTTVTSVRLHFYGGQNKSLFTLVLASIFSLVIFIPVFSIKFMHSYGDLAHLYRFPLWLISVPICYMFYHFTYRCISACTRFLFMCCLSVSVTFIKSLLESKPLKVSFN